MEEETTAQSQLTRLPTLGEKRVRALFNPSENTVVADIKRQTAALIDLVEGLKNLDPRLAALAQTHYEDAAMWAVKLATSEEPAQ